MEAHGELVKSSSPARASSLLVTSESVAADCCAPLESTRGTEEVEEEGEGVGEELGVASVAFSSDLLSAPSSFFSSTGRADLSTCAVNGALHLSIQTVSV